MSNGDIDMEIRYSFTDHNEFNMWDNMINVDPTLDQAVIKQIVEKNHHGLGCFSYDGLLDDLTEIVGYDHAHYIVSKS